MKWCCECSCGNHVDVEAASLLSGHTLSCGCLKSKGEALIQKIFEENNIDYIKEKAFSDCRFKDTNGLARFDFYLPQYNIIIEYDGEQHFHTCGYLDYEKQHNHDLIKNKYCFKNNIPLIRIPYDVDYTIDDLKLETTRFLLTPENEEEYYNRK